MRVREGCGAGTTLQGERTFGSQVGSGSAPREPICAGRRGAHAQATMGDVRSGGGPGVSWAHGRSRHSQSHAHDDRHVHERRAGMRSQPLPRGAGAKISALPKEHGYMLSFKD